MTTASPPFGVIETNVGPDGLFQLEKQFASGHALVYTGNADASGPKPAAL